MPDIYEGSVCYQDGWHYSVIQDANGYDIPDAKLFLDDDGTYRLATDDDESWHDRKHGQFATIELEDGDQPGLTVSTDDMAAIKEFLAAREDT